MMAQHFVPGRQHRRQFSSRTQAHQLARRYWVCEACNCLHPDTKPTRCDECGSARFHYFQSGKEAARYQELQLLERALGNSRHHSSFVDLAD